jgi:chemotaxis protein MotB
MNSAKRRSGESTGPNVGLVMTVALFLILLTFFVLLCSIAVIDEEKTRVALGSLVGSFGSLPKGVSPLDTGESVMSLSAPIAEDLSGIERIISGIDEETLRKLTVETKEEKQVITVNENHLFDPDSHTLKASSISILSELGRYIRKGDYPVEIIGHTDNTLPHVKGYRSNWELSGLAALAILKYFTEETGVPPARLTAYGAGAEKPFLPNTTREARQKNKRVEIVLHDAAAKSIKRHFQEEPSGLIIYRQFDFRAF